ncbi:MULTISPECIES: alpha/beta hydrolase [Thalassospira]|jgi:pimeloyl-ACP methyl ester carboxylesterase|uniref:Alpha/beta hydrolase n=1 Tax=Thalassospira xiamenensis TaxID=220697 RepID=A0ABR5XWN5_9PROT|nr:MULTISPECIES: alpha/beta hydrolase [Thalassospira]MAL30767.1 alpha/beta hydrolase [Thalassospira sp.]MBR9779923.1 alpha/beta hydrolase [Rhodospirillales bacterium]KZC97254.1 alpha/beta hydrolase [Thalassospira xiamenensis]KZD10152.1 alpha/beta hydrolase [Thalassospira xiamenensis]MBL4842464.1 alpha/beta fold hydrolase [Thalassospira sp.]|tara:strand:- start:1909 stop:2745 length:837 start_codon:yes stop_codon:yes gene_type:complete
MSPELEIFRRNPSSKPKSKTPIVFVHGAFTGAWCWNEHFLTWFADQGFETISFSLRGHGGSGGRDLRSLASIDDYVEDLETVVDTLGQKPILIGHSMGGYIIQKYLEKHKVTAAVLMASVPPEGLLASNTMMAMAKPDLYLQMFWLQAIGPHTLLRDRLGRAMLSPDIAEDEGMIYFGRLETESHRALMDMMGANPVFLSQTDLPPILAIGARNDEIIQSELVNHTAKRLGADCILLDDIAHAMMLDAKWEKAASQIAKWLEKNVIEKQDSTSKKTAA